MMEGKDVSVAKRIIFPVILLIAAVFALSMLSVNFWREKGEKVQPAAKPVAVEQGMTVARFGEVNGLPPETLKKVFPIRDKADLSRNVDEFNLSRTEIVTRVEKARTVEGEYKSKNWFKIPLKFALWIIFLASVFALVYRRKMTPALRKGFYLSAVVLFGIILGSDPSPMGTVKDAIVLLGSKGIIFPPRLAAMTVFLVMVLLANKFICAWGCQIGTLQDLIFRLNRDKKDRKGLWRQYRLPFPLTNGIRIAFFLAFTVAAFAWATDIVEPIDPFKIYKPLALGIAGGLFTVAVLLTSAFIYRPWCHFLCPFGLVGWLVEKVSLFKIRVNYETCIACESCAKACPSTVMEAILKQDRVIPDCFSCATCINVCPTGSVRFSAARRGRPPEGKFTANGSVDK